MSFTSHFCMVSHANFYRACCARSRFTLCTYGCQVEQREQLDYRTVYRTSWVEGESGSRCLSWSKTLLQQRAEWVFKSAHRERWAVAGKELSRYPVCSNSLKMQLFILHDNMVFHWQGHGVYTLTRPKVCNTVSLRGVGSPIQFLGAGLGYF